MKYFVFVLALFTVSMSVQAQGNSSKKVETVKMLTNIQLGYSSNFFDSYSILSDRDPLISDGIGVSVGLMYRYKRKRYFDLSLSYHSLNTQSGYDPEKVLNSEDFNYSLPEGQSIDDLKAKNFSYREIAMGGVYFFSNPLEFTPYVGFGYHIIFGEGEIFTGEGVVPLDLGVGLYGKIGLFIPINEKMAVDLTLIPKFTFHELIPFQMQLNAGVTMPW